MTTIDRRRLLRGTAGLAAGAALATSTTTRAAASPALIGEPQPLDGRPFPAYDYTRANRLPREMTGYWTKSFDIAGTARTAKVYISSETPIRSYYTVIAVPDGVDTAEIRYANLRSAMSQQPPVAGRTGHGVGSKASGIPSRSRSRVSSSCRRR